MLITVIALVAISLISRIAIQHFSKGRVATGIMQTDTGKKTLSGCEGLSNCTASTASNTKNRVEPFSYSAPQTELIATLAAMLEKESGVDVVTADTHYLHATFKTKLLGYTDDFELLLDDTDGTLNVRSASRIGRSDLGANRKRIESLRSRIQ